MITIDKKDALYKYLHGLNIEDIEEEYISLAKSGRYRREDVLKFWSETFRPSLTEEVDDSELEKILDYYLDLKTVKKISGTELKSLLKEYKQTNSQELREKIINSQLKDLLYMCVNYCSLHKDEDIQEVVQIANIGLLTALDKYDAEAKIDFKDYIIYYVRKTIIEEFGEKKNG